MSAMIRQPGTHVGQEAERPFEFPRPIALCLPCATSTGANYPHDAFSLRDTVAGLIDGWRVPVLDDSVWDGEAAVYLQMPKAYRSVVCFVTHLMARGY